MRTVYSSCGLSHKTGGIYQKPLQLEKMDSNSTCKIARIEPLSLRKSNGSTLDNPVLILKFELSLSLWKVEKRRAVGGLVLGTPVIFQGQKGRHMYGT